MQNKTHPTTYRILSNLLVDAPDLNKFINKLELLQQISAHITTHLEPSLANQCRVANLRDGSLILSTSSPAWHHKLRYASIDLLSNLRANPNWSGLKSIEVRVDYLAATTQHNTATNFKKPSPISANNAKLLRETAAMISCKKLSNSLMKLGDIASSKPDKS